MPGRTFSVAFGLMGSQILNKQSKSPNCRIALSCCATLDSDFLATDGLSPFPDGHLTSTKIPEHEDMDHNRCVVPTSVATEPPVYKLTSVVSAIVKPIPAKGVPLADQYLDTMIMDDAWRATCWRKIRQNNRKLKRLKAPLARDSATAPSRHPKPISKPRSKGEIKFKSTRSTPSLNLKKKCRKPTSTRGSDSGFVSSSPTPNPPTYLRVRSTRNYPIQTSNTTSISIDIPASMVGRSCLSCGCTNTTCWRRTLGGIICNSCGLRYAIS